MAASWATSRGGPGCGCWLCSIGRSMVEVEAAVDEFDAEVLAVAEEEGTRIEELDGGERV